MRAAGRLLFVASLAALAACTPMRWQHPSLGLADADRDSSECSQAAYLEAQRRSFFDGWRAHPVAVRGRDGRIYYVRDPFWRQRHDAFFREQRLFDFCMRAKGYQLVLVH